MKTALLVLAFLATILYTKVSKALDQDINAYRGQNRPGNFDKETLTKVFFEKYLKEKCYSEAKQQIALKYFVNFCFILKLFSKVRE